MCDEAGPDHKKTLVELTKTISPVDEALNNVDAAYRKFRDGTNVQGLELVEHAKHLWFILATNPNFKNGIHHFMRSLDNDISSGKQNEGATIYPGSWVPSESKGTLLNKYERLRTFVNHLLGDNLGK